MYKITNKVSKNAVSPACKSQSYIATPLVHTYAVKGATCRMHSMNKAKKNIEDDLGDCNRLLDQDVQTDAVYKTAPTRGFVMTFRLPQPTTVEAFETFVKKMPHGGASGYAAPRISVKTTKNTAWQAVYSSKDVWGQFDKAESGVSHIMRQAAAFRFNHWNVHKFYTVMDDVVKIQVELFGEINKLGHNSFSMDEVRVISPKPQHAVAVPSVHVGPGKYVGCFKDFKDRDLPVSMGRCNYMTPKECNNLCAGYAFYAVQFHGECRCGDKDWKTRYHEVKDRQCNAPCNGDISIMCGGNWANSVFKTDPHVGEQAYKCMMPKAGDRVVDEVVSADLQHGLPEKAKKESKPNAAPLHKASKIGDYVGCFKDDAKTRDFSISKGEVSKITPQKCNTLCQKYDYFALQNGKECRCEKSNWQSMYGTDNDTKCDKACNGDSTSICGGQLHNTVFKVLKPKQKKPVPPTDGIQKPDKKEKAPEASKPAKLTPAAASTPAPAVGPNTHSSLKAASGHLPHTGGASLLMIIILIIAIGGAVTGTGYIVYKKTSKVADGYKKVPTEDNRDDDNDASPWIEQNEQGDANAPIVFRDDDILEGDGTEA